MAELLIKQTWTIALTTAELRLILKALGGRMKTEDGEAAMVLGDRLTAMRGSAIREANQTADRLLAAAGESPDAQASGGSQPVATGGPGEV